MQPARVWTIGFTGFSSNAWRSGPAITEVEMAAHHGLSRCNRNAGTTSSQQASADRVVHAFLLRPLPPGCQFRTLLECGQQTSFVCFASPGDIESGAMINRGPDDRQTNCDVYSGIDAENLNRTMTLIMVHRDNDVEVAPAGPEK